jgi:hypothetical protein
MKNLLKAYLLLFLTVGCQKNTPVRSDTPVRSETPVQPEAPVRPGIPVQPEVPVRPGIPVQPEVPVRPGIPVQPEAPVRPGIPVQPEAPVRPGIPVQPEALDLPDNQNIPTPKPSKNELHIENLSGNFGDVIISNKSKRIYELKNYHKESIENISANIDNSHFYFINGYPGKDENVSGIASQNYCSFKLEAGKSCKIAVTFEPKLTKEEIGTLQISYSIHSEHHEFKFNLNGKGKTLTNAQRLLAKLKDNFIEVTKIPHKDKALNKDKKIIESILSQGHSNHFNYSDFYNDPNKKNVEIWEKHLNVPRVIGYTFRSDSRGPEVLFTECSKEWREGYELNSPISGRIVKYPPQIDRYNNGINCGVKDTGGFWPYVTRAEDLVKINKLLLQYKKDTGKDFDLADHPVNNESSGQSVSPGTDTLSWYLQNVLNLSAYVHETYDYKGFVSTTTNATFAQGWSGDWVYITYVEGGFLLPEMSDPNFHFSKGGTFAAFSENEVAVAGGIPWEDVMGYYKKHSKKVYFREGFKEMDPAAYEKIFKIVSSFK